MTLNEYLEMQALTDARFADLIGCDRTTVSRWRRGITAPRRGEIWRAITKTTNGAVSPNDFLPASEPEAAQ